MSRKTIEQIWAADDQMILKMWRSGAGLPAIAKKVPLSEHAIARIINAYELTGGLNPRTGKDDTRTL